MIFEVCTESVAGVAAAQAAGAHRVELCSALSEGGVTPSMGLFRRARVAQDMLLHVLVRPRAGDFAYSGDELSVMLDDVALFKEAGADGLVFGALNSEGSLNLTQMKALMAAAEPLPVTFHRAFDVCLEPFIVLEQLVALGVARVLSSGRAHDALGGASFLKRLVEHAGDRLIVMAGGGVRPNNAAQIVCESGVRELHFSVQRPVQPSPFFYALGTPAHTDEAAVRALVESFGA